MEKTSISSGGGLLLIPSFVEGGASGGSATRSAGIGLVDKAVFIFAAFLVRTFALALVERAVLQGTVPTLFHAAFLFALVYSVFFAIFVALASGFVTGGAHDANRNWLHVLALWLLVILACLAAYASGNAEQLQGTAKSQYERLQIIYSLQVWTLIIWILLAILALVV